MRLTHLRQPGELANRQGLIKIVADLLDNARQTSRRDPECLLARNVGGLDKSVRQLAGQILGHHTCAHHEKVHVVVLDAVMRGVQFMAQSRAHSGMLIGRHGSSDSAGADQPTTFHTTRVEGRGKLVHYVLVVATMGIPRANIVDDMTPSGKSGFETFLTIEAELIRRESYTHDSS